MRYLLILLLFISQATWAKNPRLEFTLHKIDSGVEGPTMLVVGGIQGDEPGGFHAASLLVTDYRVTRGSLWVVPNLNFQSIINRSRGVNGDMNRKFARMKPSDPDYSEVERIKELIRSPEVDFIFNMHDGSGYYRTEHIDKLHNPNRWGQSIIIDQERLDTDKYASVGKYSRLAMDAVNQKLLKEEHSYLVKNTHTRKGNAEMEKTLTYYAINNGKAAVGIEASKSLLTHERVYYHLNVLEAFLEQFGVGIERDFELKSKQVKQVIDKNIQIALFENKILLDIGQARKRIGYVPFQKNERLSFTSSNPLVAITNKGKGYKVNYGNRNMTTLQPQFFKYDASIDSISIDIDGSNEKINLGSIVNVSEHFTVSPLDGYRINVIGWTKKGVKNEVGQRIHRKKISQRFSVDRDGTLFRVEVYRDKRFCGMVLVKFEDNLSNQHAELNIKQTLLIPPSNTNKVDQSNGR